MADDDNDYINFGDFARSKLDMQCQYASHYLRGLRGYPNLGEGLRVKNDDAGNYHSIRIHKDDAKIFRKRLKKYLKNEREHD